MKKIFIAFLALALPLLGDSSVVGFWQTTDDKTHKPTSVIAIYPYKDKFYGRIVASYNADGVMDDTINAPKEKAAGIKGHPYYCGLDIVIDMAPDKPDGHYFGSVIDPREGKIYRAEMWRDGVNLNFKGKYLVFWKNQTWLAFPDKDFTTAFPKPDTSKFIPKIPEVI